MHPRPLHGLLALALAGAAALPVTAAQADPAPHAHSRPAAAAALSRARGLFSSPSQERRASGPTRRREVSMVLNELASRLDGLDGTDRRTATRLLARPSDGANDNIGFGYTDPSQAEAMCTTFVCVHWMPTGIDAPPATDADGNGIPDQVDLTARIFDQVWQREIVGMHYHAPLPDRSRGNDTVVTGPDTPEQRMTPVQKSLLDVYLVDSGAQGIYGYCAPDLKAPHTATTAAGYCGVDNDFSTTQFRGDPLVSLKATAAHEFFHAVQFGYDRGEDTWLMESTAAWIEDEVYDGANDNRQYLRSGGPLAAPGAPLDFYDANPGSSTYYTPYGDWIFWKLVGETYGADVVRRVWTRAALAGQYSLSATRHVLAREGTTLTQFFARFGAVNRYPGRVYSEGSHYPRAPLAKTFVMSPTRLVQKQLRARMAQLSNLTVQYKAADTMHGTRSLRIGLAMAPTYRGSAATAVVHFRDGSFSRRPIRLDKAGDGRITVPFTRSRVANVELTLTNASSRFDCSAHDYRRACHGTPRDDKLLDGFTARVIRS